MASFSGLTPGIYWSSESSNPSSWEVLNEEVINGEDTTIDGAKYILIVTGVRDVDRRSFHVKIPRNEKVNGKVKFVYTEFNNSKNYGTIYQWHFFLAYKKLIDALTNRLNKISESSSETKKYCYDFIQDRVWTTTIYNSGSVEPNVINRDIAIQWIVDFSNESAGLQFIKDTAVGFEVTTYDNGAVDNGGENSYTGFNALKSFAGAYYCRNNITDSTVFYPLKSAEQRQYATSIIVNTRQTGDRAPFRVSIEDNDDIINSSDEWPDEETEDTKNTLTKYQWQMFFAYSDLVDLLYKNVNENDPPQPYELSKYGLPGMIWTSSDYICKPNTLGAAEIAKGNGLKWVVCPAFGSSHIVLKTNSKYNFPTVENVDDLM